MKARIKHLIESLILLWRVLIITLTLPISIIIVGFHIGNDLYDWSLKDYDERSFIRALKDSLDEFFTEESFGLVALNIITSLVLLVIALVIINGVLFSA